MSVAKPTHSFLGLDVCRRNLVAGGASAAQDPVGVRASLVKPKRRPISFLRGRKPAQLFREKPAHPVRKRGFTKSGLTATNQISSRLGTTSNFVKKLSPRRVAASGARSL